MARRHHRQRRRHIVATAAIAILATACSSGSGPSDAAPPRQFSDTTADAGTSTSTSAVPTSTSPVTTTRPRTAPTVVPVIATTPVTVAGGRVLGTLASVDGRGNAVVELPATIGRPAIVHAQHDGAGPFRVTAIDSGGLPLGVVAQSTAAYSGTFPIGFVDETGRPTSGLTITTDDAWHLDISQAALAPALTGAGVAGHGDTVLSYRGPAVSAHVTASGGTPFTIHTYDRGVASLVTNTLGPYDARITLPAGPAFISVTAAGDWSMSLG